MRPHALITIIMSMTVLAGSSATLLDYQDVGVLLLLRCHGLRVVETPVKMQQRVIGASRVFRSWWVVGKYMLQTSLLSVARFDLQRVSPQDD